MKSAAISENTLNKVSVLNRMTVQDLKKTLGLIRLVTLIDCVNLVDEDGNSYVDVPLFGKIMITKDLDFEFIPETNFKKDVFDIKRDPELFLKKELKTLLKIED